ncbi:MAG: hypothetical protein WD696_01520 [Bryobacteraceae bacterium]
MRTGIAVVWLLAAGSVNADTYYLTVAGLGGEPDFEQRFDGWAKDADKILKGSVDASFVTTLNGPSATRANVRSEMEKIAKSAKPEDVLVLFLIGHGTFDGTDYKINLPGPDMTGLELAGLLDRIPATRQLVVNSTSSGGGSIDALRRPNRVVISATKSGTEKNATVFGRYWVEALRDPAADADKNETVSALEAYRFADGKTTTFYETQKRLATEHAVLEDTGNGEPARAPSSENGQGLVASAFPVLRLGAAAKLAADPEMQKLLAKKEDLEQQIDRLKYQKAAIPTAEYKKQLAALLLELARTQAEIDK